MRKSGTRILESSFIGTHRTKDTGDLKRHTEKRIRDRNKWLGEDVKGNGLGEDVKRTARGGKVYE